MTPMSDLEASVRRELGALTHHVSSERYNNPTYRVNEDVRKRLAEIHLELERAFERIFVNNEPGFS